VPGGGRGDQRLGAVPAGHADRVSASRDGVLGKLEQVIAGPQDDRLDAAPLAFLGEVEPLPLAARSSDL
jgi:hypothetical protein